MKTTNFEEQNEQAFYDWKPLQHTEREPRTKKIQGIIFIIVFALMIIFALSSCTTARVNRIYLKNQDNKEIHSLCESYFITVEQGNRENNTPNEQDSILYLIRRAVK